MREAFVNELEKVAIEDNRVVVISGDLGFRLFDRFAIACPGRFLNAGIAEQNMVGVAAGMALCGLRPICYSIATFMVYRCFEQIRLDCCYHCAPVILVGVGGGLGYSSLGVTHHATEDVAIMRSLPNMTVISPCDPLETRAALREALKQSGPVYIRLGRHGEPGLRGSYPSGFKIGKAIVLREGRDITILASGPIVHSAISAADILCNSGIDAQIVSVHTPKPLDDRILREAFSRKLVAVVEEHSLVGGIGSAVAEWHADNGGTAKLVRLGLQDSFIKHPGGRGYTLETMGLSPRHIAERIIRVVG